MRGSSPNCPKQGRQEGDSLPTYSLARKRSVLHLLLTIRTESSWPWSATLQLIWCSTIARPMAEVTTTLPWPHSGKRLCFTVSYARVCLLSPPMMALSHLPVLCPQSWGCTSLSHIKGCLTVGAHRGQNSSSIFEKLVSTLGKP